MNNKNIAIYIGTGIGISIIKTGSLGVRTASAPPIANIAPDAPTAITTQLSVNKGDKLKNTEPNKPPKK